MTFRAPQPDALRLAAGVLVLLCLSACGEPEGPITVTHFADRPKALTPPSPHLIQRDDAFRLRISDRPRLDDFDFFNFKLPNGWTRIKPTTLRNPNFSVTAAPEVQVYATVISAKATSVLDNVKRWYSQMGQDKSNVTQETLDALPTETFLDGTASPYVDIAGTYEPRPTTTLPGARMIAILADRGRGFLTLKMVGPDAIVAGLKAEFFELAASFALRMPNDATHGGGAPRTPPPVGPAAPKKDTPGTPPPARKMPFAWDVPDTWNAEPINPYVMGAFRPKSDKTARCTISIAQGSLLANVNRWRNQLGAQPIDGAALDALPTRDVLDGKALIVRVDGSTSGGMGIPTLASARLLGVIRDRGGGSFVFVKMIGTPETMETEEAAFFALCDSMKEAK